MQRQCARAGQYAASLFRIPYPHHGTELSRPPLADPLCVGMPATRDDSRILSHADAAAIAYEVPYDRYPAPGSRGLPLPRTTVEAMSMVAFARQQVHLTSRTHTTGCIALVHKPQRSVLQSVFFCHSGRLRLLGRVAKHGRRRRHHELGDRRRGQPRLSAGGEQMHTGQQVSSRRACLFLLNPSPWYRRPHVFALRVCDQRRRSKRTHVRSAASLRRQACLWDCHSGSRGSTLHSILEPNQNSDYLPTLAST